MQSALERFTMHGFAGSQIRSAIQAALVPWLLGDGDPFLGDGAELTGPWTCALIGLQDAAHEARALEILRDPHLEDPIHELRQLDAHWRARLPFWPAIEGWSTGKRLRGPGGISIERTPCVWIVRSFARWSAFVSDAELRRAHLPSLKTLGPMVGSTSLVWCPDDEDLTAKARRGANLDTLAAWLRARRGPPASSRLDAPTLPEGPDSWWVVPLPT